LAISYNKLGDIDKEIQAYEMALKGREQYPQALYNLAFAYEEKSENEKAIKTWTSYVEIASKLPTEQQYVQEAKEELERLIHARSQQ
jgi:tetratricopeptide (TPR) repeat protein